MRLGFPVTKRNGSNRFDLGKRLGRNVKSFLFYFQRTEIGFKILKNRKKRFDILIFCCILNVELRQSPELWLDEGFVLRFLLEVNKGVGKGTKLDRNAR